MPRTGWTPSMVPNGDGDDQNVYIVVDDFGRNGRAVCGWRRPCEPTLLAEIEYRAKSAEGKVRHPIFKGLREDL
jgi:hypothetical protein